MNASPNYYYILTDGNRCGPCTVTQLRAMWASGVITATSTWWREGYAEWHPISEIEGILAHNEISLSSQLMSNQETPVAKKQVPTSLERPADYSKIFAAVILVPATLFCLSLLISAFQENASIRNTRADAKAGIIRTPKEVLGRVSTSRWINKVNSRFGLVGGDIMGWPVSSFVNVMGQPDKVQRLGDTTYWYYGCTDGQIQLSLDTTILSSGMMHGQLNSY